MLLGCYHLHLYCDGEGCTAGDYGQPAELEEIDEHGATCRARARRRGWRIRLGLRGRTAWALCPACVAAKRTVTT